MADVLETLPSTGDLDASFSTNLQISPTNTLPSLDDSTEFVVVKSRKRHGKFHHPSNNYGNGCSNSNRKPTSSNLRSHGTNQDQKCSEAEFPEEYAANIHEIHASIQRTRTRVETDCGPLFLTQLVASFAENFRNHLQISGPDEIVCYALGRFSVPSDWGFSCRLQLVLLQELTAHFRVPTLIFDPAFSEREQEYLQSEYCGFSVISVNEEAKRIAVFPTLFYMIHAENFLYENLIEVNRSNGNLHNVVLFGNTCDRDTPLSDTPTSVVYKTKNQKYQNFVQVSEKRENGHLEKKLPIKDRCGLFSVALTPDTVLHFYSKDEKKKENSA